ncbi:hypothetical protein MGSAQ_003208, partial [marine sediment metagenome]
MSVTLAYDALTLSYLIATIRATTGMVKTPFTITIGI